MIQFRNTRSRLISYINLRRKSKNYLDIHNDARRMIERVLVCRHGAGQGGAVHVIVLGVHRLLHDEERHQHRHGGDGETAVHEIGY